MRRLALLLVFSTVCAGQVRSNPATLSLRATVAPVVSLRAVPVSDVSAFAASPQAVRISVRADALARGVAIPIALRSNSRILFLRATRQADRTIAWVSIKLQDSLSCGSVLSRQLPLRGQTYFGGIYRRGCDLSGEFTAIVIVGTNGVETGDDVTFTLEALAE